MACKVLNSAVLSVIAVMRMFLTLLVVAFILIISDAPVAKVVLVEISRAHTALALAVLHTALSIV